MKHKITYIFLLLIFTVSLVLGSFSIRPFTKLLLPWMMFDQWRKVNFPAARNDNCIENLKNSGAFFFEAKVPESDIQKGCMIDSLVVVSHLNLKLTNVAYPPQANYVSLSCDFASRLNTFIKDVVIPASTKHFKKRPTAFLHKGGYACRGQRDFTSIKSEHAFAQAIDFAGILFDDGTDVIVERDYGKLDAADKFFAEIFTESCNFFGTSLGPEFNELHHDHFHWSIGFPKVCQ